MNNDEHDREVSKTAQNADKQIVVNTQKEVNKISRKSQDKTKYPTTSKCNQNYESKTIREGNDSNQTTDIDVNPTPSNSSSFNLEFQQFLNINHSIPEIKETQQNQNQNSTISNPESDETLTADISSGEKPSLDSKPKSVSPPEDSKLRYSRSGRLLKKCQNRKRYLSSDSEDENQTNLRSSKKRRTFIEKPQKIPRTQVAKKRPKHLIEKKLYVSDSQKDFLLKISFIERNGMIYIPVSIFREIYSDFSVDLAKLETLLKNQIDIPNYLYQDFSITHISILGAVEILKGMNEKPKFIYDWMSKLTVNQAFVISEDYLKIESKPAPKSSEGQTLSDLSAKKFSQELGLYPNAKNKAANIQSQPKMNFCLGKPKPFFRQLIRPIWNNMESNKENSTSTSPEQLQETRLRKVEKCLPGWKVTVQNLKAHKYSYVSPDRKVFSNADKAMAYQRKCQFNQNPDENSDELSRPSTSKGISIKPFRKFAITTSFPAQDQNSTQSTPTSESKTPNHNSEKPSAKKKKKLLAEKSFNLASIKASVPSHSGEGWFTAKINLLRHLSEAKKKSELIEKGKDAKLNEPIEDDVLRVKYSDGIDQMLDLSEWNKQRLAETSSVKSPEDEMETQNDVNKRMESYTKTGYAATKNSSLNLPNNIMKFCKVNHLTVKNHFNNNYHYVNSEKGIKFPNLTAAFHDVHKTGYNIREFNSLIDFSDCED